MGGVCTACAIELGRDGVARGHVLDFRRDVITTKGEVHARVRRVGRLGDRLFQSSGVLVLDDGVREAGLLDGFFGKLISPPRRDGQHILYTVRLRHDALRRLLRSTPRRWHFFVA